MIAVGRAAASDLPAGLPDVTLGMTKAALLAARPAIERAEYTGKPVNLALEDLTLNEKLPPAAWPYTLAQYRVYAGRLAEVDLYGSLWKSQLRAARLQATATARALWGGDYAVEVRMAETIAPVLIWETKGREARLRLPPDPGPGSGGTPTIHLDVGVPSDRPVQGADHLMPAAKRARLLEECGVEDRRRRGPADLGYDEYRAVPESAEIDGRAVILTSYLRRDFEAPRPAGDPPMTAVFTLRAKDGRPFPSGVRFERAWVRSGWDVWRIPSLKADAPGPAGDSSPELRASVWAGPPWPAREADAVVRLTTRDGRALMIRSRESSIVFSGLR